LVGLQVLSTAAGGTMNFGNTSVTGTNSVAGVRLGLAGQGNAGGVTFADLDIAPDSGHPALLITEGVGTTTSTSGTITATAAQAINSSSSVLSMILDSVSASGGASSAVNLTSSSGSIVMNGGTITGNSSGRAFLVNSGTVTSTYKGNISQANATELIQVTGGHNSGTIQFSTGTLSATNGTGLLFDNADGNYTFNGTTTLNGGDAGIDIINGSGGQFSFGSGTTITNPSGIAYREDTSTANVNIDGTISKTNNAANAVSINAKSGGLTGFNGSVTATTTTANAVNLTSNTGGSITFGGGLALSTTSGIGFNATGGGTVIAAQTPPLTVNTIASTTGTALNVVNTNIGGGGLTFRSISSNGGTADGIILDTTGSTGGLTVVGDGTNTSVGGNGSGGTIANKGGADNTPSQGTGIYLNNTRNVVLRRMTINGTNTNYGIRGTSVNGFTLEYSTVGGINGTNFNTAPYNAGEGSIYFGDTATNGVTGTATFTSNNISGGQWNNFSIINTQASGNTLTLSVKGNTFGANLNNGQGNHSMLVENRGTGTINTTLGGTVAGEPNTFTAARADLVNFTGQQGSVMDVVMRNNIMSNNHAGNNIGGSSLTLATQATMTYHVTGNTMRDADGSAVTLFKAQPLSGPAPILTGFFDSNTIGVAGVVDSGSKSGNGIFVSAGGTGTMSHTITNNSIHQIKGNFHISADNTGGSYAANFDIRSNTFDTPGSGNAGVIGMTNGSPASADTINVCAVMGGSAAGNKNTIAGYPGGAQTIFLGSDGAAAGHTFNLPTLAPTGTEAGVESFVAANNNMGGTVVDAFADAPATFAAFTGSGTNCGTPPSRPADPAENILLSASGPRMDILTTIPIVQQVKASPLAIRLNLLRYGTPNQQPKPQADQPDARNISMVNEIFQRGNEARAIAPSNTELALANIERTTVVEWGPTDTVMASASVEIQLANVEWASANVEIEPAVVEPAPATAESGPSTLAAIVSLVDKMAAGISPTVYSQETDKEVPEAGTVTVNGGGSGFAMPTGKSTTITFRATVSGPTTPVNTFSVSNQGTVSGTGFSTVSTDGDPGTAGAQPTVTTVVQPPTITKSFTPANILLDQQSTLTLTINNTNPAQAVTGITVTDVFPTNVVVASPLMASTTCGAGTLQDSDGNALAPGDVGIRLVGGTRAANQSCTVTVSVRGTIGGTYMNTTGNVASFEGFVGTTASSTLNVSILTASELSISGRVTTAEGRGIRGAVVTITGNSLTSPINVITGINGTYSVEGLAAGETYIVTVRSRRFAFESPSRVVTLIDNVTDADFIGSAGTNR
ncbi:MAG: carboxypeptidase regulatory-like domain-containing protein, partial [Pyrinomonadaceae bacterium]